MHNTLFWIMKAIFVHKMSEIHYTDARVGHYLRAGMAIEIPHEDPGTSNQDTYFICDPESLASLTGYQGEMVRLQRVRISIIEADCRSEHTLCTKTHREHLYRVRTFSHNY